MGYDGLFLGRIDYEDLMKRFTSRTTEMIWHTSKSLGSKTNLFTGILANRYSPPPGFCFDKLCSDEPIIDDKNNLAYNIDRKVKKRENHLRHHFQFICFKTQFIIFILTDTGG